MHWEDALKARGAGDLGGTSARASSADRHSGKSDRLLAMSEGVESFQVRRSFAVIVSVLIEQCARFRK